MKKSLLIGLILCASVAVMSQEDEEMLQPQEADSVRIKGVHPWDLEQNAKGIAPEIAHWSIIPHIGFSAFDGDFTNEMKHRIAIPTLGLGVEYNFTPVWNVGVEYLYDMYAVIGDPNLVDDAGKRLNADTLLSGHMHKAGAYVSVDVINLFFPRVRKKIVSFMPYFGAGGAWYKRSKYYMDNKWYDAEHGKWVNPTHDRFNTANYINEDGVVGPDRDKDYRMVGYLQGGASVDFNLNRTFALGLRANYTYFTRDYVDGRGYHKQSSASYASKNDDGIFDITAFVRFKLEAVSKSHPRNMPSFDTFDKILEETNPQIIPHDTIIYHRHDSVIIRESAFKLQKNPRIFNVYFDNDKSFLREDALNTIFEASSVMEEDTTLYAVLIGYCDNTASKAYNYSLAERRAKNVIDEMLLEYEIPESHVFNAGVGKIAARKSTRSYGPNRRVSIHLVDKETFELMKLEVSAHNEERNEDEAVPVTIENSRPVRVPKWDEELVNEQERTIPLSQSAPKKKENQYKKRVYESIVVEKGATLSQLARKYYDNSQCWIYIFMANREVMSNPTDLPEGKEIIIPELTEKEMQLTVNDCLRLYSATMHNKQ